MAFRLTDRAAERARALVRAKYHPFRSAETDRFVEHFRGTFGPSVRAIIFYGSCLSKVTRSADSMYDFFIICDSYDRFYAGAKGAFWKKRRPWVHAGINRFLPPNIYEADIEAGEALGGGTMAAKYCVVDWRDLKRETSLRANDLYHLGRFSKRMGVAFTATERELDALIDRFVETSTTVGGMALGRLAARPDPGAPFTARDFVIACLSLSYEGESRVEAPDKVEKLFRSEEAFYEELYGETILPGLTDDGGPLAAARADGSFELALTPADRARLARDVDHALVRSRRRGKQRWPKLMFLYEDWITYILDKIERTTGQRFEVTETQRRFWPILGWKTFFEIRRAGLIKSLGGGGEGGNGAG